MSVRLDNAGSPYAMYSALKGNTGKNAVLYQLRFKKGHQEFMPHSDMWLAASLNKTSSFVCLMGGAFEPNFYSTVPFLQCCEENMRNAQQMPGDRGDGHA